MTVCGRMHFCGGRGGGRVREGEIFFSFVLGFYCPVNNEVMSSRSVNSGTVPGQA